VRKGQRLGRLFVTVIAVSVLSSATAWALGAPETPGVSSRAYVPTALYVPDARPEAVARASALLERQQTEAIQTARPQRHLIASIERSLPIKARPGGMKVIGQMPSGSRYYGVPHQAWILKRSGNGRFGKVAVPYSARRATGWIRISGLELSRTRYSVRADLSRHLVKVLRGDKVIMRIPATTGAAASPTPPGRYFVTDRVPIPGGGSFGTYAFGISGIQPNLPPGWGGGDQLAIHGTSDPGSIGTSASAGCLRVSERALGRLKPILGLGTPITIER
jgi:lipoprotein-anchoring transpeptidase ErfK/SrfK